MIADLDRAIARLIARDAPYERADPMPHYDHDAKFDDVEAVLTALLPSGPRPRAVEVPAGTSRENPAEIDAWHINDDGIVEMRRFHVRGKCDYLYPTESDAILAARWAAFDEYRERVRRFGEMGWKSPYVE